MAIRENKKRKNRIRKQGKTERADQRQGRRGTMTVIIYNGCNLMTFVLVFVIVFVFDRRKQKTEKTEKEMIRGQWLWQQ